MRSISRKLSYKSIYRMGIKDEFGKSGKADDLLKYFQIDKSAIIKAVAENN